MRILYVSTEVVPYAKTGGLADVVGALPPAVAALGHEALLVMPYYRTVRQGEWPIGPTGKTVTVPMNGRPVEGHILHSTLPESGQTIFFIACDAYFDRDGIYEPPNGQPDDNLERFSFFGRAVLELIRTFELRIDVIHLNDWPTGLIPAYLKSLYRDDEHLAKIRKVLTIHNLAFQGVFPAEQFALTGLPEELFVPSGIEFYGQVNLLKAAIAYADRITTVSETYAREIQTAEQGVGLEGILKQRADQLSGIVNGIDTVEWNPATDPMIARPFSADKLGGKLACKRALQKRCDLLQVDVPLIGVVSRLTDQKGFDLFRTLLKGLLKHEFQLVVLGTGEPKYHTLFTDLGRRFASRIRAYLSFDNRLAHQIMAGSDLILMPSRYEPCGLSQMYAMRYGTVPLVRRTGGLADTVVDYSPDALEAGLATGFVFDELTSADLYDAFLNAFDLYRDKESWTRLMQNGLRQDFGWAASAEKYVRLYEQLCDP